jgi:hypothetical protein
MTPTLVSEIVDTSRYPIEQPGTAAYDEIVAHCKSKLQHNGLCLLPDFIRTEAQTEIQNEAHSLSPQAHRTEHWRATPNGVDDSDESRLPVSTRAAIGSIAYDRLSPASALRALYQSQAFTDFLNNVFDGETLYPTADPLIGCMLTVLKAGDELGWHYDPNDMVVSLSIQVAQNGGEFEFAPRIRKPADHARVNEQAVLEGHYSGTISETLGAGTLSFFNGHRSLHRVAPVGDGNARIIALFNYSNTPAYTFSDDIRMKFFGRRE